MSHDRPSVRGIRLPSNVSRRDLMRGALLGAGLVALGPLGRRVSEAAGAVLPNHRRLVVVNLSGGCDTMNLWVPQLTSYGTQRGAIALSTGATLALNGTSAYRVHGSMPRLQGLWNAGRAAAVQLVGYPTANLSHFESQDIYSYGVRNGFGPLGLQPTGWIARYADLYAQSPLGAVSVGMGRPLDFVGGVTNPLLVSSLSGFAINGKNSTAVRTYRLQTARAVLSSFAGAGLSSQARDAIAQAHDLTDQVQTTLTNHNTYLSGAGITWPNTSIARNLKDVAALIHGGFETRIFYTGQGGYDTHGGQVAAQASLFSQLDAALGAFADEMQALGVWQDVAVVVITEFGRRNFVNGSSGTDHGHAYAATVVGGSVSGGSSYGPDVTDAEMTVARGYPDYQVDFRSIYKELVSDHLGADAGPVFPEPLERETTLGIV